MLSLPAISYELYKFFYPALYSHEKKFIFQFIGSFVVLFIFGLSIGYFYTVPVTMKTLFWFSELLFLPPIYDFAEFYSVVGTTLLMSGLIFTFPVFLVLLVKTRVLRIKQVTKNRKYLYGGLVILIVILDPKPSLLTETVIFIPIVILTEISIILAKQIEKNR